MASKHEPREKSEPEMASKQDPQKVRRNLSLKLPQKAKKYFREVASKKEPQIHAPKMVS